MECNLTVLSNYSIERGFPCGSLLVSHVAQQVGKESACNVGDLGLIPGLGRSPGEENGNPLQYFRLGNPINRGAWQVIVHGVAESGHDLETKQQLYRENAY